MARFRRLETGLLTIGLVGTAKYFVPRLLARFRQEHPGVDVRLQVSQNREQLLELLHANECDLAVMGRPPKEMATRAEPFAPHPLVFVAPPDHPVLRLGHPPAEALAPYPFIVREPGSGTRSAMDAFFREHRMEPRLQMELAMAGRRLSDRLAEELDGFEFRRSGGMIYFFDEEQRPLMENFVAERRAAGLPMELLDAGLLSTLRSRSGRRTPTQPHPA